MATILTIYPPPHANYDSRFDPVTVRARNKEEEYAFLSGHSYLLKKCKVVGIRSWRTRPSSNTLRPQSVMYRNTSLVSRFRAEIFVIPSTERNSNLLSSWSLQPHPYLHSHQLWASECLVWRWSRPSGISYTLHKAEKCWYAYFFFNPDQISHGWHILPILLGQDMDRYKDILVVERN